MTSEQYTLFTSTHNDDVELARISILSFQHNPLHYLTYPNCDLSQVIDYHFKSMIMFKQEEKVETIEVLEDSMFGKRIVAFAILFLGPKPPKKELKPPSGADFKFLDEVKKQTGPYVGAIYQDTTDISQFNNYS